MEYVNEIWENEPVQARRRTWYEKAADEAKAGLG